MERIKDIDTATYLGGKAGYCAGWNAATEETVAGFDAAYATGYDVTEKMLEAMLTDIAHYHAMTEYVSAFRQGVHAYQSTWFECPTVADRGAW